jgi:predicted nucleotidyltransferase
MYGTKKFLQNFVLRTNNILFLREIYKSIYWFSLDCIVKVLSSSLEVIAIYLEGSATNEEIIPGSSDLDLIVVIKEMSIEETISFLDKLYRTRVKLRKIFPFFVHCKVMVEPEFSLYTNTRSLKKLYGKKIVKEFDGVKKIFKYYYLYYDFLRFTRQLFRNEGNGYVRHQVRLINNILSLLGSIGKSSIDKDTLKYKLVEKIKSIEKSNFFVKDPNRFITDSWIGISSLLLKTFQNGQNEDKMLDGVYELDLRCSLTKYNIPQETQKFVINSLKSSSNELYKNIKEVIECIILSSNPNCNYSYILYVIIKDDISPKDMEYLLKLAIDIYQKFKNEVSFNTSLYNIPLMIPKSMFLNYHIRPFLLGPTYEKAYLLRHGIVLEGKDVLRDLEPSYYCPIFNNTTTMFLDIPLGTQIMYRLLQIILRKGIHTIGASTYLDPIFGAITSRRLFFDKGIITTTPREAFEEFLKYYSREKETKWYSLSYEKYCSLFENPSAYKSIDFGKCFKFLMHNINITSNLMKILLNKMEKIETTSIPAPLLE